jgi:hypothetical protein
MEEFEYFMIRVRRGPPAEVAGMLSGMAERLGTGEKWNFGSGDELLRIIGQEASHQMNMQIFGAPGNQIAR